MSKLVNLEKRFENALEKLELAFANNNISKASENFNEKEEVIKDINHNNNGERYIYMAFAEKSGNTPYQVENNAQ